MPLREMAVPNRPTTLPAEAPGDDAGGRPGERPPERPQREVHARAPPGPSCVTALCSRCCAASSSPMSCAFRSRRASMDSTSAVLAATARSIARAGADGAVLQPRDLLGLGFERLALGGERGQRPLVLLHPLPIEPVHRGRRAVGTADRLQVVEIEQQPPVAGASQLVQLDEAGLDIRTFGVRGVSKRRRTGDRRGQLRLRPAQGGLDRREILGLQLALDLELAELDEQCLLLRGQRLGFALQRADPVGDALGDRVGARAIGRRRLRGKRKARHRRHDGENGRNGAIKKAACHRCRLESEGRNTSAPSARCP